jgi:hypothetical protein
MNIITKIHAINHLQAATTTDGILASVIDADNYQRIWARDGVLGGIAGLLIGNKMIIDGLKDTLVTLANYKHPVTHAIPSNVDVKNNKLSFGSTSGRVDASTWWLVGAGLYVKYSGDKKYLQTIEKLALSLFNLLESWEYNGKHLLYTPLSGNWADEFPCHGYLLYDNALYLWATTLWADILKSKSLVKKAENLRDVMLCNFWPKKVNDNSAYQMNLYNKEVAKGQRKYFACGFNPGEYYPYFDAAGNALALITGLYDRAKKRHFKSYLNDLWMSELKSGFVPAFWPVIEKGNTHFNLLSGSYSYEFKNKPNHFHNGGIWPIWMGLLAYGMRHNDMVVDGKKIGKTLTHYFEELPLYEYIDSHDYKPSGKQPLTFTAAGVLFAVSDDTMLVQTFKNQQL